MSSETSATSHDWLLNPRFDLTFIVGVTLIAIFTGAVVLYDESLFLPVLALDLWILGYHHVVSTYTRLAFDTESLREHRYKILLWPILVAAAVSAIALKAGPWMLGTIYLYWQWYHYARQSEGISKAYAGKARYKQPANPTANPKLMRAAFYLVPIAGILNLSARAPEKFLFMPLKTLPVNAWLLIAVNIVAAFFFTWWLIQQLSALRKGESSWPYFMFMMSHFLIYLLAYIVIPEINYGWLVINVWHNLQYILFVWLFNHRKFGNKIDENKLFLSTISQSNRFLMYIAVCLTLSTAAYYLVGAFVVDAVRNNFGVTALAASMIVYQTINFHHYIVDATIWKLRKKTIRSNLGIS